VGRWGISTPRPPARFPARSATPRRSHQMALKRAKIKPKNVGRDVALWLFFEPKCLLKLLSGGCDPAKSARGALRVAVAGDGFAAISGTLISKSVPRSGLSCSRRRYRLVRMASGSGLKCGGD